ncbi:hypothetical protein FQR65_LT13223 [Abscondita terminalis]|nr:hypothetical protein FQR65_LT13223 [Abscondita terminalis]
MALEELRTVFTSELAHTAHISFLKQIGLNSLELALNNHVFLRNLCREYEQETKLTYPNILPSLQLSDFNNIENRTTSDGCNITGSNIPLTYKINQRTLKITLNPDGLIRWLAVSSCDMWLGTRQSSGHIAVLDTKTGLTISTWRAQ